jgi:uncharacterized protein
MSHAISKLELPSATPGCVHHLVMHEFIGNGTKKSAYIHAGLHADEHPGMLVVSHLVDLLEEIRLDNKLEGTVVLIPNANPVGLSQNIFGVLAGRFDLHNGENFNRNFPSIEEGLRQSLIEKPIAAGDVESLKQYFQNEICKFDERDTSRTLKKMLLREALRHDIVLDLHCDSHSVLHLYAADDQRERALSLGIHLNARAVLLESEAGGQPFDESYTKPWRVARDLQLVDEKTLGFSATIELRGHASFDDKTARNDALGILKFLESEGILTCTEAPTLDSKTDVSECSLEAAHHQLSPSSGLLVYKIKPGDHIHQGDVIAEIVDMEAVGGGSRRSVFAELTGLVVAIQHTGVIRAGQRLALIAGTTNLSHRVKGNLLKDF